MKFLYIVLLTLIGFSVQAQIFSKRSKSAQIVYTDTLNHGDVIVWDSLTNKFRPSSASAAPTINRSDVLGYKEYVALLTQTGTDAPVATVLYNDLGGAVVWTYFAEGNYIGTLAAAFPVAKTAITSSPTEPQLILYSLSSNTMTYLYRNDNNTVYIMNQTIADEEAKNGIASVLIKIRVYN